MMRPMITQLDIPRVSLITSWFDVYRQIGPEFPAKCEGPCLPPPSIRLALMEGFEELDLYFLNNNEIPWYWAAAGRTDQCPPGQSVTLFAASLTRQEVSNIAKTLLHSLGVVTAKTRLIGWRPRIVGLATYFPSLSSTRQEFEPRWAGSMDLNLQRLSVRALKNALFLGYELGAKCVEAVGGTSVPDSTDDYHNALEQEDPNVDKLLSFENAKIDCLVESIRAVYTAEKGEDPDEFRLLPNLSLELEPGDAFLLNELRPFRIVRNRLKDRVKEHGLAYQKLCLNIDIAHAFIIGYNPEDLGDLPVGHIHLSDHAADKLSGGLHSNDLSPGKFHTRDDYAPWLKYAIELCRGKDPRGKDPIYSGFISIEQEACNQLDKLHLSVNTIERWLRYFADQSSTTSGQPGGASTLS